MHENQNRMKRLIRISLLTLILLPLHTVVAQNSIWSDNFESYVGTGSIPTNFGGGMRVYSNHGTSASKALTIQFSPFKTSDSTITTTIGPIVQGTNFTFDYRFVSYIAGSAFNGYTINTDRVEVFAAIDGSNNFGTPLLTINSSNHISALEYASKSVDLSAFEGQNIQIKIRGIRGNSSDYWLDVDNFNVQTGSNSIDQNTIPDFSIYPNPSLEKMVSLQLSEPMFGGKLELLNMLGSVVFKKTINQTKIELDVEDLPRGVYYVKLDSGKKQILKKLVLR
jgi:hypothetical protein